MAALSGAFSGLLAAGITQMDGVGGYAGWRWIFIIEGAYTNVEAGSPLIIESPQLIVGHRARDLGHRFGDFFTARRLAIAFDSMVELRRGDVPRITAKTQARRSQLQGIRYRGRHNGLSLARAEDGGDELEALGPGFSPYLPGSWCIR